MTEMTQAASDVLAERQRQIEAEGFDASHDDKHDAGQLTAAACSYAMEAMFGGQQAVGQFAEALWPWGRKWWKPKDKRRDLVRAAALLLAEIERLDRAAAEA